MKKVLFVASLVKIHLMVFHIPYLKWFKEQGYEVHVCAKNDYKDSNDCKIPYCDVYHDIPFQRNPIRKENIEAYKMLKTVINSNNFDIIHCHTPIGGALTRIAARKERDNGTKVLYTAHGFHFFKGAPLKNWIIFYPVEKWLSKYTDVLITMNEEDYSLAKKKFKSKKIKLTSGIGVDIKNSPPIDRFKKRKSLKINEDDFVVLSVGELSKNKNHEVVIKALEKLKCDNIVYIIAGEGSLKQHLQLLADRKNVRLQLLGFRNDIKQILEIADLFIFPSLREGLPVSMMEAMNSGLPVIASNVRGNRDLVKNNINGVLVDVEDVRGFSQGIDLLYNSENLRKDFGEKNRMIAEKYGINNVLDEMINIYTS